MLETVVGIFMFACTIIFIVILIGSLIFGAYWRIKEKRRDKLGGTENGR